MASCYNKFSRLNAASDNGDGGLDLQERRIFGNVTTSNSYSRGEDLEELNDISSGANDPICRVVATSDGKIPPYPAISSLSPSSRSLLEKIELLYSVQSQKELRDLAYVLSRSMGKEADDEFSFGAMETDADPGVNGDTSDTGQEEKLVSILKRSLNDGGFKLMEQRDLDLCSALNAGYLLRLSLLPETKDLDPCIGKDFYPELYEEALVEGNGANKGGKKVSSTDKLLFDGRVLVFRRGYSKEVSTGRLLLPKLDYLQASLVQRSTTALTRRFGAIEQQLEDDALRAVSKLKGAVQRSYRQLLQQGRDFTVNVLENFGLSKNEIVASLASKDFDVPSNETSARNDDESSSLSKVVRGNRIFKFGRYKTSTSSIIPDSFDLNDALTPFLLCEVGADATTSSVEQDIYDSKIMCQYDDTVLSMRNTTLEGQPVSGLPYRPDAVRLLERISIQNTVDFFSKKGRRDLIRNFFKSASLVEPAYEEVIVIWRPLRKKKPISIQQLYPPKWLYKAAEVFDMEDRLPERRNDTRENDFDDGPMPLEIKAFYDVPMANIEAVLPKNRLVFRPADAIVFDLVSVISFLAVAGSVKFDSPRLDLIALVSLAFFSIRTFFRYSNKYARYDLLVNKFLTSKISHRGPGALKYIISEADTNRALRAMLVRDWLSEKSAARDAIGGKLDGSVLEQGRSYVNYVSSINSSQIDIDIPSAIDDLERLKLIDQAGVKEEQESQDTIKKLWDDALD